MAVTQIERVVNQNEYEESRIHQLVEEGYRAIEEGRISTLEEVREKLKYRREQLG